MKILSRLPVVCLAALALAPVANAKTDGAATASGPKGLKAFLLRVDESERHSFPRTPSFAWKPVRAATSYSFELSTSRAFTPTAQVWTADNLKTPAVAIPIALPWITGHPYSLYAHVRSVTDGRVSSWSAPYGFDMRWPDPAKPLPSYPGMVRWTPVEGATSYEVWLIGARTTFFTTTNVADERDLYDFHNGLNWTGQVKWRVRPVRTLYGKLPNGLPRTTVGPWSPTYTNFNPPFAVGDLTANLALSDDISTAADPRPHRLTPGFAFNGATRLWGTTFPLAGMEIAGVPELFHVYVFTDKDCVNPVYVSALVGSPGYAPRENGTLKMPASPGDLLKARSIALPAGSEGVVVMADGRKITATEENGSLDETPIDTGTGTPVPTAPGGAAPAPKIDLWDAAWPNGGYFWTVIPVTMKLDAESGFLYYQDTELPQDACQSGHAGGVLRFGKLSQPVVTGSGSPFISGMTTTGRMIAATHRTPVVYGSPLVAWSPALGATAYEVQWSSKSYPWKPAAASIVTPSTSALLPLKPGRWFYRVRGLDASLPGDSPAMSWSAPVAIKVAKPVFKLVG